MPRFLDPVSRALDRRVEHAHRAWLRGGRQGDGRIDLADENLRGLVASARDLSAARLVDCDVREANLEHVHLGNLWKGSGNWGEATVGGSARLMGRHVSVESVTFHTEGEGRVELTDVEKRGDVKIRADGGPVSLEDA